GPAERTLADRARPARRRQVAVAPGADVDRDAVADDRPVVVAPDRADSDVPGRAGLVRAPRRDRHVERVADAVAGGEQCRLTALGGGLGGEIGPGDRAEWRAARVAEAVRDDVDERVPGDDRLVQALDEEQQARRAVAVAVAGRDRRRP